MIYKKRSLHTYTVLVIAWLRLWEDTLRYVNWRSLVHDEAESGLESGRQDDDGACKKRKRKRKGGKRYKKVYNSREWQ